MVVQTDKLSLLSTGGNLASINSTATTSYTLTLPNGTGSANQVLTTDGTGILSWSASGGAGSVTSITLTTPAFLSVNAGNTATISTSGTFALTLSGTALPVANGGSGVTTSSGASSLVLRDANQFINANNFISPVQTIVSSGATVALTVATPYQVLITGSSTSTVKLPNATTLTLNTEFLINNNSTLGCSLQYQDGTALSSIGGGGALLAILLTNGTANGTWDYHYLLPSNALWSTSGLTMSGNIQTNSQLVSTVATGTAPLVVSSTTNVANLNASSLNGATFAAPGAIGGTTPSSGAFTSISATGNNSGNVLLATVANGTAPIQVNSATVVANLNASAVNGLGNVLTASTAYPALAVNSTNQIIAATTSGSGSTLLLASTPTITPTLVIFSGTQNISLKSTYLTASYNWNYPATVGTAGQFLTSQAGGTNAMTWTTPTVPTARPMVTYYPNTSQTLTNNTNTLLTYDTKATVLSSGTMGLSFAGSTYTCTTAGQYKFIYNTQSSAASGVAPVRFSTYIGYKVNNTGTEYPQGSFTNYYVTVASNQYVVNSGTCVINMAVGDVAYVMGYQNTGSSQTITNNTTNFAVYFQAIQLYP